MPIKDGWLNSGEFTPRYSSPQDVIMRLGETLCTFLDEGILRVLWLGEVIDMKTIHAKDMLTAEAFLINPNDALLKVNHHALGFVNRLGTYPVYAVRPPSRSQRSGVVPGRLRIYSAEGSKENQIKASHLHSTSDYYELAKCVANIYPTITQASNTPTGAAFSRRWALVPTKSNNFMIVVHRTATIGLYDKVNRVFSIPDARLDKAREFDLLETFMQKGNCNVEYQIRRVMG